MLLQRNVLAAVGVFDVVQSKELLKLNLQLERLSNAIPVMGILAA